MKKLFVIFITLLLSSFLVNGQCINRRNISLKFINIISSEKIKEIIFSKIDSLTKSKSLIHFFTVLEIACNKDSAFRHIENVELNLTNKKWVIYSSTSRKKLSFFDKITSLRFSANRKGTTKIIYIDSISGKILKIRKEKSYGIACSPKY